jgi:hypothetical protein
VDDAMSDERRHDYRPKNGAAVTMGRMGGLKGGKAGRRS